MDPGSPVAKQPVASADADASALLAAKLEMVTQDRARLGETNQKLNERLQELESKLNDTQKRLHTDKTQQLESQGKYEQLYEEQKVGITKLQDQIRDLEAQLGNERQTVAQERLKAAALNQISRADVVNPEQMYQLLSPNLREEGGQAKVLDGGVEVPLNDFLINLKNPGSGWEHFFSASNLARGMGAAPGNAASVAPGMRNPWRAESFSVTEQFALQASNPELATALQAEASRG
jgi:hypothetical protein